MKEWKRKENAYWFLSNRFENNLINWLESFWSRLEFLLSLFARFNASIYTNCLFIAFNAWNIKVTGYGWKSLIRFGFTVQKYQNIRIHWYTYILPHATVYAKRQEICSNKSPFVQASFIFFPHSLPQASIFFAHSSKFGGA